MGRPREFDRDDVLLKAMHVFWRQGFASTSTDELATAMGMGRQSLYNTFGSKRQLYLDALDAYQSRTTASHLQRLQHPASPVDGIRQLLTGLAAADDAERALGCLGVCAVGEFGATDPDLTRRASATQARLHEALVARLVDAQERGQIAAHVDALLAATFLLLTMSGLQLAARAGADLEGMQAMARFAVDRLVDR